MKARGVLAVAALFRFLFEVFDCEGFLIRRQYKVHSFRSVYLFDATRGSVAGIQNGGGMYG